MYTQGIKLSTTSTLITLAIVTGCVMFTEMLRALIDVAW